MHKKIIILVLALTLALANLSFVSAAPDTKGHWAEASISYLMKEGIVKGYPCGSFKPNDTITRAEFITIINGALNLNKKASINFTDVSTKDWFYEGVRIARGENYLEGYTDNTVKPNANITREEASVIIGRALKLNKINRPNQFTDSNKISSWAQGYINEIHRLGYINGYPDGSFKPQDKLSRSEAVTMIIKSMNEFHLEELEVMRLVNIERQKAGLRPLDLCAQRSRVARDKSKDMAYGNYFSHTSPIFGSPFDMMKSYGIQFTSAAENIARGHTRPQDVVKGWMNSPGHKANILNSRYNKIGIGYHDLNSLKHWTQMFTN